MLGAFMSGLTSGAETMLDLRHKADELRSQLESNEALRQAGRESEALKNRGPDYGGGGEGPSSSPDFPIPTDGSGGSGGGSGGGGAGGVGDTSATGVGHSVPISERLAYYEKRAGELGLNYNSIAATVHGEGLHNFYGDKGQSFGDFQLYTGGGMGNEAEQAGIDIRNPNNWKEAADYALGQMAQHKGDPKWYAGQWHGAPGWAAQNFSDPNAAAPRGWSVPTYAGKQPSTIAGPVAGGPAIALGGEAGGKSSPVPAGQPTGGGGKPALGQTPASPTDTTGVWNVENPPMSAGSGSSTPAPAAPDTTGVYKAGPIAAPSQALAPNPAPGSITVDGVTYPNQDAFLKAKPKKTAALNNTYNTQWGALA